jgi:hypothetical protein
VKRGHPVVASRLTGDARRLEDMALAMMINRHHAQMYGEMDVASVVEKTRALELPWQNVWAEEFKWRGEDD